MQFSVYQETHIGGRKVNQDRMGYSFTRDALLLVLADGMGGHARGEVAAAIATQTLSQMFQQQAAPYVKGPERFLEDAFHAAHREIHRFTAANNMPESPRTTIVACLVQHNTATWAHCGDSRLYWIRNGQIHGRTRDHSHVENIIEKGQIPASARATHPDRNKLYNCLGANSVPRVDISGRASLLPGDTLLLCSDGLWSMLPDEEVVQAMSTQTVVRAVPEMLSTALRRAGDSSDNVTALAIMWQGTLVTDSAPTSTQASSTVISTEALPDDLVSTTIHGKSDVDMFDDDEIEKAIAEIRGAIEKSSQILK
jgi:protein phosphatase